MEEIIRKILLLIVLVSLVFFGYMSWGWGGAFWASLFLLIGIEW